MRPAEPMCSYFFDLAKHMRAESLRRTNARHATLLLRAVFVLTWAENAR